MVCYRTNAHIAVLRLSIRPHAAGVLCDALTGSSLRVLCHGAPYQFNVLVRKPSAMPSWHNPHPVFWAVVTRPSHGCVLCKSTNISADTSPVFFHSRLTSLHTGPFATPAQFLEWLAWTRESSCRRTLQNMCPGCGRCAQMVRLSVPAGGVLPLCLFLICGSHTQ